MKISLNWIKKYVDINIPDDELIRLIGARLVEVEGVIDESTKYDHIYIVRVASAEKIPDTHLTLCQIDVNNIDLPKVAKNTDGTIQVVCGAPNVREGMLAVWIAPGATVPASVHEDQPFVIGKRKMLGTYESNGMLAGADELDFGDDHSGIVEIEPNSAEPGMLLKDLFDLDDKVLEIENKSLTHRPDTFGIIGFAREVAGILGQSFDFEYQDSNLSPDKNFEITVEDPNICERYTAIVLKKHGELKKKYLTLTDTLLAKSGIRPINPIVDVTNYLMLLTGQPLHAFDYDKFLAVGGNSDPKITIRRAKPKETIELLDGTTVSLINTDIVICSGDTPVALAGAMGGKSTMIDDTTKNIIIESATFSLYNLRKTQMAHGIFSEAITRFTKGQPPYQCLMVGSAAAKMLEEGFEVSLVGDTKKPPLPSVEITITPAEINGLLGTAYDRSLIIKTLQNVGFTVDAKKDIFKITAPLWRTDIHIKEDIIEEVGRLLGYDNIPPVLPLHATADKNQIFQFKEKTRNILSSFGMNEVLTYSFVSGRLLEKATLEKDNSYRIVNSISPELQYVRQSIIPSLLEKTFVNQKIPFNEFALFEINKVCEKSAGLTTENVPKEKLNLGFVLAERKSTGAAYYKAKYFVEKFFESLGITADFIPQNSDSLVAKPFEKKRSALISVDGDFIGVVGEFKNSVKRSFKISDYTAGAEIDFEKLLEKSPATPKVNLAPIVEKRDLTVETTKSYGEIISSIKEILKNHSMDAKISPLAIYQPEEIKHISVHLEFTEKVNGSIIQELESIK